MKTRVFNLIILDESGSMQCIKKEAIDSVNETIQTIRQAEKKNPEQEHYVSLVTFNHDAKTIYDCIPAKEISELTCYYPNCCTALYDAMGMSLTALRDKVAKNDRVLVTIITDGYENASHEYSGKAIKSLVKELKDNGWVFAYIGANQDVEAVAASISITNTLSFDATPLGTKCMSGAVSSSRDSFYESLCSEDFSPEEANKSFFKKK